VSNPSEFNTPSRMLFIIAGSKLAEKTVELLKQHHSPIQYTFAGTGTATSEMMDLLGLGTAEKTVVVSILPRDVASHILSRINDLLQEVERASRGIAFTLAIPSATKLLLRLMGTVQDNFEAQPERKEEEPFMTDKNHTLITAIVNQGYSEEVMNAARGAGARGGTVIHTRRISDEKTVSATGLGVQEEQELILILADAEHKLPIMQAIGEKCGVHSDAKGIVLSLPIDSAVGLR